MMEKPLEAGVLTLDSDGWGPWQGPDEALRSLTWEREVEQNDFLANHFRALNFAPRKKMAKWQLVLVAPPLYGLCEVPKNTP